MGQLMPLAETATVGCHLKHVKLAALDDQDEYDWCYAGKCTMAAIMCQGRLGAMKPIDNAGHLRCDKAQT